MRRKICLSTPALLAALLTTLISPLHAQGTDFPTKPIRMYVPFTAGSGADSSARAVAEHMSRSLGQPVTVENRPGASGALAAMTVKQSPADGYSIFVGTNSPMSVNPIVTKNLSYDPLKDFKALHGIGRAQNIWYVAPDSPIKTITDLVALAKTKPVNVGSYSAGYQLAIAWVSIASKTPMSYVPYKGQAQVFTDVIGKQLDAGMGDLGGSLVLVQSGKLRPIAVSGENRHPSLPNVPTLREVWPEYVNYSWTALWVRTETPADVHEKLAASVNRAMKTPEMTKYFETQGAEPMYTFGPVEMNRYRDDEYRRFKTIADTVGIKPE
jgi:tripartite-type tricarboxylate transporter receptor subunit TctC